MRIKSDRGSSKCPVCGAVNFECVKFTGVTFVRRDESAARWRSARRVLVRRGGVFALAYRVGDPVDVVEAVRQGLAGAADLSAEERRHLVEVSRRKVRRAVADGPPEDKQLGPAEVVRKAMDLYVDEEDLDGGAYQGA